MMGGREGTEEIWFVVCSFVAKWRCGVSVYYRVLYWTFVMKRGVELLVPRACDLF
jgi:hypothetical protein